MNPNKFLTISWALFASLAVCGQDGGIILERVPERSVSPAQIQANLGNSILGTGLLEDGRLASGEGSKAIGQDKSDRVRLPSGPSSLPMEFADLYSVNRTFFRSYSAAGSVRILGGDRRVERGSGEQVVLVPQTRFGPGDTFDEDFADRSLQTLVFEFELTSAGEISPLGVMGNEFIQQASALPPTAEQLDEIPEDEKANMVPYDFASLLNGTSVALINAGPILNAHVMIDDDITTQYEVESDGNDFIFLLDLKAIFRVNRLTMVMDAAPGRLDLYLFNILPLQLQFEAAEGEEIEELGPVVLEGNFFDTVFPIASREYESPVDVVEVTFEDTDARYALIRWVPNPGTPAGSPINLSELSLIGMIPDNYANVRLIPSAEFAIIDPLPGIPIPNPEPIPVEVPPLASPR